MKCMQRMNVITKISCHFERSVVTLKLRKEYLNTVTYNTLILLTDKILNSLMYRTLFYVNIYGSYKLLKTVRFFGPPCMYFQKTVKLQGANLQSFNRNLLEVQF